MTTTARQDPLSAERKNRVALHTLAAAYRNIHAVLDGDAPSAEELSSTYERLADALVMLGTNGEEALRGIV